MGTFQKQEMEVSCKMKCPGTRKHRTHSVSKRHSCSCITLSLEHFKLENGVLQERRFSAEGTFSPSRRLDVDGKSSTREAEVKGSFLCDTSVDAIMGSVKAMVIDQAKEYTAKSCHEKGKSCDEEGRTYKFTGGASFSRSLEEENILLSNLASNESIPLGNFNTTTEFLSMFDSYPHETPILHPRKKLLILDINGLLADIVYPTPKEYKADTKIAGRAIFKRPFCSEFLNFCLERFDVGIWSSRSKKSVDRLVHYLLGDLKHKLIFCWDLSHCTDSKFRTLENRHKALVFKDLARIWKKFDPSLPWQNGAYDESNTLLLDDSPYKALLNPPNTAIFPYSYDFRDRADNSIGPEGNLRIYLEGLAVSDNVQDYVKQHPFGQSAINERCLSWQFYDKVLKQQYARLSAGR